VNPLCEFENFVVMLRGVGWAERGIDTLYLMIIIELLHRLPRQLMLYFIYYMMTTIVSAPYKAVIRSKLQKGVSYKLMGRKRQH
jgi:hypothetical protein